MAYKKHEWQKKEPITAEKLNNLENGVEEALKQIAELQKKLNAEKIEVKEAVKSSKK